MDGRHICCDDALRRYQAFAGHYLRLDRAFRVFSHSDKLSMIKLVYLDVENHAHRGPSRGDAQPAWSQSDILELSILGGSPGSGCWILLKHSFSYLIYLSLSL